MDALLAALQDALELGALEAHSIIAALEGETE